MSQHERGFDGWNQPLVEWVIFVMIEVIVPNDGFGQTQAMSFVSTKDRHTHQFSSKLTDDTCLKIFTGDIIIADFYSKRRKVAASLPWDDHPSREVARRKHDTKQKARGIRRDWPPGDWNRPTASNDASPTGIPGPSSAGAKGI
jgi:hypothetical protein